MYARDMPRLAEHGMASPEGLVDVATFVLLTIQQHFHYVGRQMVDVRAKGEASVYLFGAKRDGYRYVREHAADMLAAYREARGIADGEERKARAIEIGLQVPGLGVVKSAFLAQCLGFETACLDTHNIARFGLRAGAFKFGPKATAKLVARKVRDYVRTCDAIMPSADWWDSWCDYVAGRRGSPLTTADAVSEAHASFVCA